MTVLEGNGSGGKNPSFLTECWDPLDLLYGKKLLGVLYMHPGGMHTAMDLFFFLKKCKFETP